MFFDCLAPIIFCSAVAAVLASGVCLDFSNRSRAVSRALRSVMENEQSLPRRALSNFEELSRRVSAQKSASLHKAWKRYTGDFEHAFGGAAAPDPRVYFNYNDIFSLPSFGNLVSLLWALLPLLGVLSVSVPLAVLLLNHSASGLSAILYYVGLSLVSLSFIALVFVFSKRTVIYIKASCSDTLCEFNNMLSSLLPVVNEVTTSALLLSVTRESARSFRESADLIGRNLNDFAVKRMAPVFSAAFDYSIDKTLAPTLNSLKNQYAQLSSRIVEQQEAGMRALADKFALNLESNLGSRMKALSESVGTVNERMETLVGTFSVTVEALSRSLEADRNTLGEACMRSLEAAKLHKDSALTLTGLTSALDKSGELLEKSFERDEKLVNHNSQFASRVEDAVRGISNSLADNRAQLSLFQAQSSEMWKKFEDYSSRADASSKTFAEQSEFRLNALLEKFSSNAAEATEKLRESVLLVLDKNRELNEAIKAQNDALKDKYDSFFVKVDSTSTNVVAETEFRLQAVFSRFSEEATAVMDRLGKTINDTMSILESNTGMLLSSLEEQSRNIGLYAKELSLDASGLSGSLKESVSVFTAQLGESTAHTFEEFDKGLSDITERLSILTGRISESVENLPKLLDKMK